jgi:hypothetical protein
MRKKHLICPMMAILALCSCKKKSEVSTSVAPGTDIYFVGQYYPANDIHTAAYWKNGKMVLLADTLSFSNATAIAVNGTDVYVAGCYSAANSVRVACYWKNGKRTSLGDSTEASFATDLTLNGPDLYVAGTHGSTTPGVEANYWKNGQLIPLPSPSLQGSPTYPSFGVGIAVNGTDIYVTGTLNVPGNLSVAACWKNGVVQFLGDTTAGAGSEAGAIAINNGDIYIAGQTFANSLGTSVAAYWKNGKIIQLPNDSSYSYASGIAVNGTRVYLAGYQEKTESATLWNNGMITTLSNDGYKIGSAGSIALDGADVYVGGGLSNGTTASEVTVYWKNGTLVTTGIYGEGVKGMVVVSH